MSNNCHNLVYDLFQFEYGFKEFTIHLQLEYTTPQKFALCKIFYYTNPLKMYTKTYFTARTFAAYGSCIEIKVTYSLVNFLTVTELNGLIMAEHTAAPANIPPIV